MTSQKRWPIVIQIYWFEVLRKDTGWATGQGKTMNVTNVTRVSSSKRIKRGPEGLPWWSSG